MKKIYLLSSLICLIVCFSNAMVWAQNQSNVIAIGKTSMNKSAFESTSLYSSKLMIIPDNSEFEILEERKGGNFRWYKISYRAKTGWITDTGVLIEKKIAIQNPQKPIQTSSTRNLSKGAALLFKGVKSRLSDEEKNKIFDILEFSVSKDKEMFCLLIDKERAYPFTVFLFPTDLNKDGIEEIFIAYGNTFTSGITGSSTSLIIKGGRGNYEVNIADVGGLPEALANSIGGFPDLLIPGRGFEYPVFRWNGSKYKYNRQVSDAQLAKMRNTSISLLSKAYQKQLSTQIPKPSSPLYSDADTTVVSIMAPVDSVAHTSAPLRLVGQITTAQRNIVLYDTPNINLGEPMLILRKNASVQIEQEYSNQREKWYKVTTSGITGWINAENTRLNK